MTAPATRPRFTIPGTGILSRPVALLLWLVPGLLVSTMLISAFASVKTVFQIIAESEHANGLLDIAPAHETTHLQWLLHGAVIRAQDEKGARLPTDALKARLSLDGPALLEAERVAMGSLRVALREAPGAGDAFSVVLDTGQGNRPVRLAPPVFIEIPDPTGLARAGKAISLPFKASELSIGREPKTRAAGIQPILRSGEVTVFGRTSIERRLYIAKSTLLRGGDVVAAADPASTFNALLRVDERPAIHMVSRVETDRLAISGFFTDTRYERLTLFDMLANDRILTGIWSLLGLAIAILGTYVSGVSTFGQPANREAATPGEAPDTHTNPPGTETARLHAASPSTGAGASASGAATTLKRPAAGSGATEESR